jgi:hypothetical protein
LEDKGFYLRFSNGFENRIHLLLILAQYFSFRLLKISPLVFCVLFFLVFMGAISMAGEFGSIICERLLLVSSSY